MNIKWLAQTAAAGLLFMAAQAHAVIILTPDDMIGANLGPANCEVGCVYDAFGLTNDGTLDLLYKADEGSPVSYSGLFADSYLTSFSPVGDPTSALIEYVLGSPAISCPECYMAVKDGNANPSYYFYNLMDWNGTESIQLTGFWEGTQGAISHVSIWGRNGDDPPQQVSEPAVLFLLGAGLIALAWARRRHEAV